MAPRLTKDELATMREHCTPAQMQALELWAIGYGYRRIALALHISPTSAKDRIRAGLAKVGIDLEVVRGA